MRKLTREELEGLIDRIEYFTVANTTTTMCALILKSGFVVVGKSACINPSDFDTQLGEQIAREDALAQLWELEGYNRVVNKHA